MIILLQIKEVLSSCPKASISTAFSCKAIFNLEVLSLVLIDQESIKVIIQILIQIVTNMDEDEDGNSILIGGARCVGCIFAPSFKDVANKLHSATVIKMKGEPVTTIPLKPECSHYIELIGACRC